MQGNSAMQTPKGTEMDGMLTIKMAVALPTTNRRMKRVMLAKSWCKRDDVEVLLGNWAEANPRIDFRLIRAEWVAQEMVFMGDES